MDGNLGMALAGFTTLVGSASMIESLVLATLAGVLIGVVPGLGGKVGLAVLIPITFGMEPLSGAVMLVAMHAAVGTGAAVPSILLGIPGSGAAAATVVDGYPMTKRGEAGRAIGASLAASAVGGIIGAGVLAALLPFAVPIVLAFGPPEIFALTLLGITLIASLSGNDLRKGLIVGSLGLMISFVGMDPQTGAQRYTFGHLFLWGGVDLVSAMVAVFAIPEIIVMGLRPDNRRPKEAGVVTYKISQLLAGVSDTARSAWLVARTSALGAVIGLIPGLGGSVAAWFAYGVAVQTSREPEKFGSGEVAGVIAPEAANNSKEGGALLPTLLFGIPGSSGMAVLLGGLIAIGIAPGLEVLQSDPPVVWILIWTLVIANLIAVLVFFVAAQWIDLAALVNSRPLVPFIAVFCFLGSWLSAAAAQYLPLMLGLGALAYALKRTGWPIPPFAVGLVLGRTSEVSLHRSLDIWGTGAFLRPLTLLLLAVAVASVGIYLFRSRARSLRRSTNRSDLAVAVLILAILTTMCLMALDYPLRSRLLPLAIGIPAALLCLWEVIRTSSALSVAHWLDLRLVTTNSVVRREFIMLLWLAFFMSVLSISGFVVGTALLVTSFLYVDRNTHPMRAATAGLVGAAVLFLVFENLLGLSLYRGILFSR